MKDKADVLIELDRLSRVKDELTEEVARLHGLLEQERSKVSALTSAENASYNSHNNHNHNHNTHGKKEKVFICFICFVVCFILLTLVYYLNKEVILFA